MVNPFRNPSPRLHVQQMLRQSDYKNDFKLAVWTPNEVGKKI